MCQVDDTASGHHLHIFRPAQCRKIKSAHQSYASLHIAVATERGVIMQLSPKISCDLVIRMLSPDEPHIRLPLGPEFYVYFPLLYRDRPRFVSPSHDKIRRWPRVSRRGLARRDRSRLLVLRHHLVSQEPFSGALNEFLVFRV
jgi:hypothetical protein